MLCLLVFFLRSDEFQRVQQANTFRQRFIIIDRRIGRIVPCIFFRVDIFQFHKCVRNIRGKVNIVSVRRSKCLGQYRTEKGAKNRRV